MERYKVNPGQEIQLKDWDPQETSAFEEGKKESKQAIQDMNEELETLQEKLYAEHKHKVLVVLQGMDTSGKDGTIRHVFEGVNPQGVRVASFKVPTQEEADHDYLWRVHKQTPGKGEITIFNRSHYEDVLVVRVHNLVPEQVWKKRYEQINRFEKLLADEGTTILKFFLHISLEEQKERLIARQVDPQKQWKFSSKDVEERKYWKDYTKAYEAVLSKTSTEWAPWYIIPSNRKWYRNLVISKILIKTLDGLKIKYPEAEEDIENIVIE